MPLEGIRKLFEFFDIDPRTLLGSRMPKSCSTSSEGPMATAPTGEIATLQV